ncbi:hypothetical protein DUZ99_08745 [Xylanibacillus composti]|uniref:Uncharacterized protein n=1 Tax=Xylanibacillus composti TaxID=1572762 RepID=A0A8J4H8H3_9BACL|nr:hypothetical protein [Xylanibacillus composti]MDT9725083.1 hypothetical protein [Xylanibacillus composti]GIQ70898.1 hypothetical protein XYCOK13_37220 [Xylanibacillus composti]
MIKKITLDMLTPDSVSVKTQQYVIVDGVEYPIGQPHRIAFVNNAAGRAAINGELPPAQANAIMAVWGNGPTIADQE